MVFVYHLRDERKIAWHGRLHGHGGSLYEPHYFIAGAGSFRNDGTLFTIEPGELFFRSPGCPHQVSAMGARKPATYYALLIDANGDEEAARRVPYRDRPTLLLRRPAREGEVAAPDDRQRPRGEGPRDHAGIGRRQPRARGALCDRIQISREHFVRLFSERGDALEH